MNKYTAFALIVPLTMAAAERDSTECKPSAVCDFYGTLVRHDHIDPSSSSVNPLLGYSRLAATIATTSTATTSAAVSGFTAAGFGLR